MQLQVLKIWGEEKNENMRETERVGERGGCDSVIVVFVVCNFLNWDLKVLSLPEEICRSRGFRKFFIFDCCYTKRKLTVLTPVSGKYDAALNAYVISSSFFFSLEQSYLFNDLVCFYWVGLGLSTSRACRVCAQSATDLFKIGWAVFQPVIDLCTATILSLWVAGKWW